MKKILVVFIAIFSLFTFSNTANSVPVTLEIDLSVDPTPETGNPDDWNEDLQTQTGTVGTANITAFSQEIRWLFRFAADNGSLARPDLYGALAQPAGTTGDALGLQFGTSAGLGLTDTVTITFLGNVLDPIFYINDLDFDNSTVTVPGGWSTRTNNPDSFWSLNTLTTLNVDPVGPGAFAAVQYLGLFGSGSTFEFMFDYTNAVGSSDFVGLGIAGTFVEQNGGGGSVPNPSSIALLLMGLAGLWFGRRNKK